VNVDTLDLDAAGVLAEHGYIPVNDFLQSNVPHIFAAGDINGQSMLVQSARYEGKIAAENAVLGPYRRCTHEIVPSGSFTDPGAGSNSNFHDVFVAYNFLAVINVAPGINKRWR
jgi:dihydrolipoamide dehydrogenase